ncbi:glycosyltransferase family 9 protein [candidate division NPL-UPA2 bacterium]|nr:glycosyltransferase family 9 protein [candidate division NPL-UPA2 bacterium]
MKISRILVIRGGALGDFILTLPAITFLRGHYPKAHLEIMGYHSMATLAETYVDKISSIDQAELAPFFLKNGELPLRLIDYFRRFHLVVSYLSDPDSIFLRNLRRATSARILTGRPIPSDGNHQHAASHLLEALKPLGADGADTIPRVILNDGQRHWASQFWVKHRLDSVVAIHPGSGGEKKRWAEEKFAQVSDWVASRHKTKVLLIQGEADSRTASEVMSLVRSEKPLLIKDLGLIHLGAILERCPLFLGNDSGITHLAAAIGTPTVALFGPSNPDLWGPRGRRVAVLRSEIDCSPCSSQQLATCEG